MILNTSRLPEGVNGITLYPFIILRTGRHTEKALINHEKIHIEQQKEMLVIFFYLWYGIEYLYNLWRFKNKRLAYKNISFERESYLNQFNLKYISKKRKHYAFLKY